jgi:drug/metabolite transporter (DMT)-like permease
LTTRVRRPGLGIALVLAAVCCFAGMDTLVKRLGQGLPVLPLLWARYAFQAGAMGLWLALANGPGFRTAHPRFQAMRGALLLGSSAAAFYALQYLPVAEFTSINMLAPVIVTLLAAWVLHEPVSRLRWALVAGGFTGAVIVIRPGGALFGWPVLLPIAGACCYATFQILTSKLSALESPYTTHFYTGATGALVLTPVLLASGIDLRALVADAGVGTLGAILAIGLLGTVGHLLLILAFGMAPTSTLMPFLYAQIAAAALLGWVAFRQLPDAWAWAGMALLGICGAASAWLNVREASAARPASPVALDTVGE